MATKSHKRAVTPRKFYPHPRFPNEVDAADMPDVYASVARGHCLEPIFHDGDCLVFSKTEKPESGDYVGLWFDPAIVPDGDPPRQVKRLAMGLMPGLSLPWTANPDWEVEPAICVEMFSPPRMGHIRASKIVAMHKVIGMGQSNSDGTVRLIPLDACLPLLPTITEVPSGMFTHVAEDHRSEPLIRRGDTAVIDPAASEPVNDGLFLIRWNGGTAEIVQVWERAYRGHDGETECGWMVGPYRRPRSHEQGEEWMRHTRIIDWMVNGPYPTPSLAEKLLGRVVGIFQPANAEAAS